MMTRRIDPPIPDTTERAKGLIIQFHLLYLFGVVVLWRPLAFARILLSSVLHWRLQDVGQKGAMKMRNTHCEKIK